jgi:MYXO-CTERM domain-containing protein
MRAFITLLFVSLCPVGSALAQAELTGTMVREDDGCGCSSAESSAIAIVLLAVFGVALRRRRR